MPLRMAIALTVVLGLAVTGRAQDIFPYTAFISAEDVNIRSGPGDNYYPVMKLSRGSQVEVYRHDPGGWYAIRPPQGSFSWVSAEFIRPTGDHSGVVIGDRVVSRVGSNLNDVRDVIQVRLDQGEAVEILEAKRYNTGPAAQTWYKISPPAGEFRWISGKFVEREARVSLPREPGPRNNLLLARLARPSVAVNDRPRRDDTAEAEEGDDPQPPRTSSREWQRLPPTAIQLAAEDRQPPDDGIRPLGQSGPPPDVGPRPEIGAASEQPAPGFRPPPAVSNSRPRPQDLSAELDELELELATMVADEPPTWDFRDLRARVEGAMARSNTAVERGQARVLLSRIERFDDIRRRYVAVMDMRSGVNRRNRELANNPAMRAKRPFSDDPRYDGVGRLAQVVSSKVGTPRYALLDETGEIHYYITPAPGVNLRNYVGRQVGVNGTLGFLPEQQRQHVTARTIVPVDDTKLR